MFIVVFFIILMISLDAVKSKKVFDTRIPKNNIRPIAFEIKIENKVIPKQLSWKGA